MNNTKTAKPRHARKGMTIRLSFKPPHLPRRVRQAYNVLCSTRVRVGMGVIVVIVILSQLIAIIEPHLINHTYALGTAGNLLESKDDFISTKLVHDVKTRTFNFNANFKPGALGSSDTNGGPQITAVSYEDPSKGLQVTDPLNGTDFTIKPKFGLLDGRQDGDRIVYPLRDGTGWLVYTMRAGSVKEDILLRHVNGDKMVLEYDLGLGDNFAARMEDDGSVGVYGTSLPINGKVSTGNEKDAELLTKARKNAPKNKLLYTIPAPIAYGPEKTDAGINVRYELKDGILKTVATELKKAKYPLTIDPTVTVTAQTDLFRDTNPESNIDFNATTGNISRGAVTGGVIPAWTANTNNNVLGRWLHGGTIYDDYAYVAGGAGVNTVNNQTTVEYARLSTVNSTIGTWANTTALPTALSRFQLVAYNGYLYAIGGATSTTSCATVSSTVYYNRIQTNGQLSGTWSSTTAALPAALCGMGAAVFDGKMYVAGGRTGSATSNGVTTVYHASLLPNGNISSWTTEDSVLPAARYDADLQVYNGNLYIVGGSLAGTPTNTVLYAPLAADGSVYGTTSASWKSTSAFGTARNNFGSTFSATNDGFMYVQGGCSTFNGSQTCTAVRNEIQVAQINADGSLGPWSDVATSIATLSRIGNTVVVWRGTVYSLTGCTAANAASVSCASASTVATQSYSKVATPGQVGPVNTTTAAPTGVFAHGSAINNGYIYIVGGCITNSCQTGASDTTGNISYATLAADGTVGSWTTDSTNRVNGATGLAAMALTVYNNYLYASGGYTYAGPVSTNFYVQLNANGSLAGAWSTATGTGTATTALGLSTARYYASSVATRGYLWVFGGCTGNTNQAGCTTYSTVVHRYTLSQSTGAPSNKQTSGTHGTVTALPTGKALMAPALYNGYVYLAGGANSGGGQTDVVYYARINDAGTITSWSTATGVLVNQLRRADAVAVNGYLYVIGGHNGATGTTYGDVEIGKIDLATGNIPSNFTNSVIQVTQRWDTRAAFSNGYIYVTGGCSTGSPAASCSVRSTVTEYLEVFNAGNKGAGTWNTPANNYATNRVNVASAAYKGYIYVAGGCTAYTVGTDFSNTFCGTPNNTTAYAALNPDGSIGTWTTGTNLTGANARVGGCLVAGGDTLYYVGGEDTGGTAQNSVLYSAIGANGVPGAWASATNITAARAWHDCAVFADRIYLTGGEDTTGTEQVTSYYSPSIAAGGSIGSWSTGTSFTTARGHHVSLAAGGYLFILGGDDGGTLALMDVQSIALNPSTGAMTGSWQYSAELPQGMSFQAGFAANGYVHLMGGRTTATSCIGDTYVASINSSGRLGGWSTAANSFTTARFGAGGVFYDGYYYLLGGHNCTAIISASVIQQNGEQSQSMTATVSKYADLNGNGKPWKYVTYLTNAVNNGVDVEKWRLRYKSSFESTNSWGVTTTVSPLTNEATYTVSALDAGSTDIKLARWWFFSMDINMELSFTFTDDTQPTIFQYGFYYSPPPSKRLMHGRDFRDQTQQGLDAHP